MTDYQTNDHPRDRASTEPTQPYEAPRPRPHPPAVRSVRTTESAYTPGRTGRRDARRRGS